MELALQGALVEDSGGDVLLDSLTAGGDLAPCRTPPLDRHAPSVYLAALGEGSRRTMRGAIEKICHLLTGGRCDALTLPWGNIRWPHTMAVRAAAREMYAINTARKIIAALRGVLKAAWRLGQIKAKHYHVAIDIPPIKGEALLRGRALSGGEIRSLFQICAVDTETATSLIGGARDAGMLAVLYGAGLRRSEVVALDLRDYNRETGVLKILAPKGDADREVPLAVTGRPALEQWLDWRESQLGKAAGPLFLPMTKGGDLVLRRLNPQAIQDMLEKRREEAQLEHFSAHDMRRSYISDLIDAGVDLVTVQKLAGHKDIQTTGKYDRRGDRAKQAASGMIHVPFVRITPRALPA